MASLIRGRAEPEPSAARREGRRAVLDGVVVGLGGQVQRLLGTFTAFALRWGLDPASLGVYTGLRLFLDQTNRSSLGVGLGAVQEIPVLRAAGRHDEAQRLADIAFTANTITCSLYAVGLVVFALAWGPGFGGPLAGEWTWGLVAVAALAMVKRYESFLVAILRAHREFVLTTKLDVLEGLVSAVAVGAGLWVAGFWGLLAAVGVILGVRIAYLHGSHPLRFRWNWDIATAGRLMAVGVPILANSAAFGAVVNLDRGMILGLMADGERLAGFYSVAVLGTSWSLDLAGRVVLVLYTYFQMILGRSSDPDEVARQAARACEVQAPVLAAGAAGAAVFAPWFLGLVFPKYAEGLVAVRPLMAGPVLLGLAWPSRQMLIAVGRPWRLLLATGVGLAVAVFCVWRGVRSGSLEGVAWGMSAGGAAVYGLTSLAALGPALGAAGWVRHQTRIGLWLGGFALAAGVALQVKLEGARDVGGLAGRAVVLAGLVGVPLAVWAARMGGIRRFGKGARG